MKSKKLRIAVATACLLSCVSVATTAQEITFEEIAQQCEGVPFNERVRISVSNFDVATPTANRRFGDELAQMLTNALQNVNCFNVLLSLKDSRAITDEIDFDQSGYTASGANPQAGKMKGPQVVVMGKVTEFGEGETSGGAFGIRVGQNKAKIGFIVQLINTETREIIESQSINVEGRAAGFKGLRIAGMEAVGSTKNNQALADACEKGIIKAVEFIASRKNLMPLPDSQGNAGIQITLLNTDFAKLRALSDALSTEGQVNGRALTDGEGRFNFVPNGSIDDLAEFISTTLKAQYEIVEMHDDRLVLSTK